jgi:hypothetical protein
MKHRTILFNRTNTISNAIIYICIFWSFRPSVRPSVCNVKCKCNAGFEVIGIGDRELESRLTNNTIM